MEVLLAAPVRGLRGLVKEGFTVFSLYRNRTVGRAALRVKKKVSAEQAKVRLHLTNATRNWDDLSVAQRDAWQEYAERHFTKDEEGREVKPSGIATYVRANTIRQLLELPMITAAPSLPPPVPLTEVQQLGAQNPDSLGLTVLHTLPVVAGHQLLVRMTPAMPTVARTPIKGQHRFVRGVAAGSAVALPVSGSDVTFSPTNFIVNDGQRYGVEVRVVRTADGVMSTPVYGDFIKLV